MPRVWVCNFPGSAGDAVPAISVPKCGGRVHQEMRCIRTNRNEKLGRSNNSISLSRMS